MTFLNKQQQPGANDDDLGGNDPEPAPQVERLLTFSSTDDEYTWFKQRDGSKISTVVAVERETYDEFGQPDALTVTIRPGDHPDTDD